MATRAILVCALTFALPAFAELRIYTADADISTEFPSDSVIYRGDCDANAATQNAGDDFDDECTCTPGVNCGIGSVPGFNCPGSEGRPNGGTCDPSIPSGAGSCPPGYETFGSENPPCTQTAGGSIVIDDSGNGTPTLVSFSLATAWEDFVSAATVSGIPGATVHLVAENTFIVSSGSPRTGTGSTTTSISWGTLSGWGQTGRLLCMTHCPGGCGGASACKPFLGFDGLGPPAPLRATAFNTDPWVFSGDGREFHSASFEIVRLLGLNVRAFLELGGRQIQVPALPLAALAGLAAGIAYLGAVMLRRNT